MPGSWVKVNSMPVRSLNSSVFKWPDLNTVHLALLSWVEEQAKERPELLRVGYFGSYARGDWGVNSDLDLICIVENSQTPFWQRPIEWDLTNLPVPTDMLVYTREEWDSMAERGERFYQVIQQEAVWVYER